MHRRSNPSPTRIAPPRCSRPRRRSRRPLVLSTLAAGIAVSAVAGGPASSAFAQADDAPATTLLTGRIDIARLLDLAAVRTGVAIRYDPEAISGAVTIRSTEGLGDRELWDAAQRALIEAGFTSVRRPGSPFVDVVRIADASSAARLEPSPDAVVDPVDEWPAGYMNVLVAPAHVTVDTAASILAKIVTRPGGNADAFGDGARLRLGDVVPSLRQALDVLESIDAPRQDPLVTTIPVTYQDPTRLAASVVAASTQTDQITGRARLGKLLPTPDGSGLLLIAPASERAAWVSLVETFDRPTAVETRTYGPGSFTLDEVATLIADVARDEGPRGSGDGWRVVQDGLTRTLIVTATPAEHEAIDGVLERLDALPLAARRSVRSFVVRNRDAADMVEVLISLLDAGALDTDAAGRADDAGIRPGRTGTGNQRSLTTPAPFTGADRPDGGRSGDADTRRAAGGSFDGRSGDGSSRDGRGGAATSSATSAPRSAPASFTSPDEDLTLTVDLATSTILAVGTSARLQQIEQLLAELDVRPPQVMVEVMTVSLTDQDFFDLGIELEKLEVSSGTTINLASLFGLASRDQPLNPTQPENAEGFTGIAISPGDFSVVLRALQTVSEGRSLIMPKLLVNDNEEAFFDSVLQEPVQNTNASDTVATTSFGGTQDAGTSVNVVPFIAEGDHLVLDYEVEQSAFVGDSASPTLPPPRQRNRLASIITIPDGYAIVVGGFENTVDSEAESRVPLLGDIPLLGELFKSRSKTTSRSRFYVFIRATILRHGGFEDLKYASDRMVEVLGVQDEVGLWPEVEPRVVRP